jgi:hypothetical protein
MFFTSDAQGAIVKQTLDALNGTLQEGMCCETARSCDAAHIDGQWALHCRA